MKRNPFEKEMKLIIKNIRDKKDYNISSDFSRECFGECVKGEYIDGVRATRNANGHYRFDFVNPTVTLKGYDFIKLKINWSYVISSTALVISLASFLFNALC